MRNAAQSIPPAITVPEKLKNQWREFLESSVQLEAPSSGPPPTVVRSKTTQLLPSRSTFPNTLPATPPTSADALTSHQGTTRSNAGQPQFSLSTHNYSLPKTPKDVSRGAGKGESGTAPESLRPSSDLSTTDLSTKIIPTKINTQDPTVPGTIIHLVTSPPTTRSRSNPVSNQTSVAHKWSTINPAISPAEINTPSNSSLQDIETAVDL